MSETKKVISESEAFIVMAVEKTAFNGMGKLSPSDIKLFPVLGSHSEQEIYHHFYENMKNLRVVGVNSLEYLRFQERLIIDHLHEEGFTLTEQNSAEKDTDLGEENLKVKGIK